MTWFTIHSNRIHRGSKEFCGCSTTKTEFTAAQSRHTKVVLRFQRIGMLAGA